MPPDEHPWIEEFGCTARYRAPARRHPRPLPRPLSADRRPPARRRDLNPGDGARQPPVPRAACRARRAGGDARPARTSRRCRTQPAPPVAAEVDGDRVTRRHVGTSRDARRSLAAPYFVDATETGDLLPLPAPSTSPAPSRARAPASRTPRARPSRSTSRRSPSASRSTTSTGEDHTIARPARYEASATSARRASPEASCSLIVPDPRDSTRRSPRTLRPNPDGDPALVGPDPATPSWIDEPVDVPAHRRSRELHPRHLPQRRHPRELAAERLLGGPVFGDPRVRDRHAAAARQLSLSLLYWLQTEAPGPTAARLAGLRLRGDVIGGTRGRAGEGAVHPRVAADPGRSTPSSSSTSHRRRPRRARRGRVPRPVGVGTLPDRPAPVHRRRQLHRHRAAAVPDPARRADPRAGREPAGRRRRTSAPPTSPTAAYRLHPVEWNIGEAAGHLAAYCGARRTPRAVRADPGAFQRELKAAGVELRWPPGVSAY